MLVVSVGSAVVLVFGSQRDVLRAWMFWRKGEENHRRLEQSSTPPLVNYSPSDYSFRDDKKPSPTRRNWLAPFNINMRSKTAPSSTRGYNISNPVLRDDLNLSI